VKVKLFADDVKMYIRCVDSNNVETLQRALNVVSEWATSWQLSLSIDKCYILNIGVHTVNRDIFINDIRLPIVSSCRDLGVIVASDLSSCAHITAIVAKAHQRANTILRCFVSRDVDLLLRAYVTYVRPLVEHDSVVWSPFLKQDIEMVERVQRKYTKRLPGFQNYSYLERLKLLNLTSLELRRLHTDLIWCYKIVFGLVDLNFDEFFDWSRAVNTRGHSFKLYKHHNSSNTRAKYFSERVVDPWNSLSDTVVNFSTLATFKRTVKQTDLSKFIRVDY
jgi:hypothetical protein